MNLSEKQKIIYFLILTFALSYALEFYVIFSGGIEKFGMVLLISLMWLPGISSLTIRLVTKDWNDIGLNIGSLKGHFVAFIIPCVFSLTAFYFCSLLDIRKMQFVSGVPISKILIQYLVIFSIGVF